MTFNIIIDPDGSKTSKWKSAWDLTERQKEKLDQKDAEERKKRKKKKKSFISQGFLDLITIGDPAVSSDNRHLKSFANNVMYNKSNSNSANNNKVSDYIYIFLFFVKSISIFLEN